MGPSSPTPVEVQEPPPSIAERSPSDVLRLVVAGTALVVARLVQLIAGDRAVDTTRTTLRQHPGLLDELRARVDEVASPVPGPPA